jgi:hypothetical protein
MKSSIRNLQGNDRGRTNVEFALRIAKRLLAPGYLHWRVDSFFIRIETDSGTGNIILITSFKIFASSYQGIDRSHLRFDRFDDSLDRFDPTRKMRHSVEVDTFHDLDVVPFWNLSFASRQMQQLFSANSGLSRPRRHSNP